MDMFCFIVAVLLGIVGGVGLRDNQITGCTLIIAASICLLASAIASRNSQKPQKAAPKKPE